MAQASGARIYVSAPPGLGLFDSTCAPQIAAFCSAPQCNDLAGNLSFAGCLIRGVVAGPAR